MISLEKMPTKNPIKTRHYKLISLFMHLGVAIVGWIPYISIIEKEI